MAVEDQDWQYLDRVISLALSVNDLMNDIKDISDNPDVLYRALQAESAALIIQKTSIEYRARLRELKNKPARNGAGLQEKKTTSKGTRR